MRRCIVPLLLLAGCGDDGGTSAEPDPSTGTSSTSTSTSTGSTSSTGTDSSGTTAAESTLEDLEAIQNPANVLSYFVQWQTSDAVPTRLEIDCGEDYQQRFSSEQLDEVHEVFVMGLFDGAACTATASTGQNDGLTATLDFTVGPLPSTMPEFTIDENDPETRYRGWTLTNLTNQHIGVPMKLLIVDDQGRPRWYHEVPEGQPGEDNDLRLVSDGLLLGGTWNKIFPAIYDWEGNQTWVDERLNHHDIRPDGDDENLLWLLSRDKDCPPVFDGKKVDSVHLYDRTLGEDVYQWNICDHYQPPVLSDDWDHINTIELVGDEAMIISSRNQHKLFYVDRASGDIVWALGQGGDFVLEGEVAGDEEWFGRQHAPEIQPNGNIVLFDNGRNNSREWSRGIEIKLDMDSMTARIVWQFRPEPDIYASIWGDADRLPNRNTLMVFGRRDPAEDTRMYEVTRGGQIAWQLRTPDGWGMYRAQRILPRYGYVKESEVSE